MEAQGLSAQNIAEPRHVLVLGMGAGAFGKEHRAVSACTAMPRLQPYFLISQWEDGSVSRLLQQHRCAFARTSFGYLGRARPLWTLINVLHMPRLFASVIRAYRQRRCTGILLLDMQALVNALPALLVLKWFYGARLVGYFGDIPHHSTAQCLVARLVHCLASRVLVNSQAVAHGLTTLGLPADRMQVVYNGVDLARYSHATPENFRQRFGWSNDAVLVGYIGQFSPNKGLWDFVQAAELVLQRYPRCRFVMLGKLDASNRTQQSVAQYLREHGLTDHLVFTGWSEDMPAVYAALDMVVVPSRHADPAPNVCIEAMASALPVVATWVGGIPELVLHGVTGLLAEKAQPEQLAAHMVLLAEDAALRQRLGQTGRERSCRLFDRRHNARQVEEGLLHV